ncbi:phosphatase PAP2 family protein [Streptomyces sp. NA04227]|uniref:phosphatase PAP2 family protein n=1 Tax=Streptomyces sp. NA04227 TaxID=2742136 RepID=UPI0020CA3E4D|nr:phosphatase PAP2 family protein [Streptomyces sp. NA04227]
MAESESRTGRDGTALYGLLRRARTPRAPRLWFEVLLIGLSYWTYSLIRNAVPERRRQALDNADWLWRLEQNVGTGFEHALNRAADSVTWLIVGMNYYYATLHFVVTLGVLVWLYRRHPGRYTATRLVLLLTTVVALAGYYLYPLAPPRLLPGEGFVDTVLTHHTWGSMASGDLKTVSNQYAAMPSMHIGWSLWCGLTIFALARLPWARLLGLLYPVATLIVIVATANHFWLDAVGGILCLAFGFIVVRLWYGALPYALPRRLGLGHRTPKETGTRAVAPGAAQAATGRARSGGHGQAQGRGHGQSHGQIVARGTAAPPHGPEDAEPVGEIQRE